MNSPDDKANRIHVVLDNDLNNQLNLILWDPVRNKPRYGARAKLINQLLRKWLRELPRTPGAVEDVIEALGEE